MMVRALLLLLTLVPLAALGQTSADADSISHPALRTELLAMEERDQDVREALIQSMQENDGQPSMAVVTQMMAADGQHLERLKTIVDEHGWPDRAMVGADGQHAVFLLIQHADSDPAFQRTYLEPLRAAYAAGEVSGQEVALLTDRILRNAGEPQIYGSQTEQVDGAWVLQETRGLDSLDIRRAEMGLPPIDEYLEMVRQQMEGRSEDQ